MFAFDAGVTMSEIAIRRLQTQQLIQTTFHTPLELVTYMGAVQAQEYRGALWALGLRLPHSTQASIEQALTDRTIVRQGFMRGTVHYLPAEDIHWMLKMVAPRLRRIINTGAKTNGIPLDEQTFTRSWPVLIRALEGGQQKTRKELTDALEQAGIEHVQLGMLLILARGMAEGLLCNATRHTMALLDEWIPVGKSLAFDESVAEFARRYFISHGPATLQDFVWWSGLLAADARAGLEAIKTQLISETIDGKTYWMSPSIQTPQMNAHVAYFLPNYDEYLVSYKNRSASLDPRYNDIWAKRNPIFSHVMMIDGQVIGTWSRTGKKGGTLVEATLVRPLTLEEEEAFEIALQRYSDFLEMPLTLVYQSA
jgi:hypothetical protein